MPRPIKKVCIIAPQQPLPNMLPKELVVMPRYGVPLIATILKNKGYDVTLFVEEIRPINWDILLQADAIGFHALTCCVGRVQEIVEQIRKKSDVPVIVGGEHVTYYPESVLRFADYVVRQEGDETIVDLLDALSTGRDPASVPGIAFHRDGRTVTTPDRPPVENFETVVDLTTIYGWEEAYRGKPPPWPLMTVQTTRGCPFGCKFCPVETMFGKGYRRRSVDSVIADLKDKLRYSSRVMFVDNLFDGDPEHAREILERIVAEKLTCKLTVFCRSNIATRPEMLALMKRAGVGQIFLGVESLNQESLDSVAKRQSVEEIESAVRAVRARGISVLASMIMGFDADTPASLRYTRKTLQKWGISQMCIFSLWGAYPHDGELLIPPERWLFRDWAWTNGSFVCHFPMRMKPSTLQREIMATYDEMFTLKRALADLARGRLRDARWRLFFRAIWKGARAHIVEYIPWLEEAEKGFYDADETLLAGKLSTRADLDRVRSHLQ